MPAEKITHVRYKWRKCAILQITQGHDSHGCLRTWLDIRYRNDVVRIRREGHVGKFYGVESLIKLGLM